MAAGQATRMGQDKLVMPWKETTVLGYVLQSVHEAITLQQHLLPNVFSANGIMEIVVVARHPIDYYLSEEERWQFHLHDGIWIEEPTPKPLSDTIRSGLQHINNHVRYIGFLPGDQVGVTGHKLAAYLLQVSQSHAGFIVPMAGMKAVSPVFFQQRYVSELRELQNEEGGRTILYRYPEQWWKYPVDECFAYDVDTMDQYNALRGQVYTSLNKEDIK